MRNEDRTTQAAEDTSNRPPLPDEEKNQGTDNVDEASRESFPASDPPAWTVQRRGKKK